MYKGKRKFQYGAAVNNRNENEVAPSKTKISVASTVTNNSDDTALFKVVLRKCGLKLSSSTDVHCQIDTNSSKFIKRLVAEIENSNCSENIIEDFVDSFSGFLRSKVGLKISLMPTVISSDVDDDEEGIFDDSIMRILLRIDLFQKRMSFDILEILKSIVSSEKPDLALAISIVNQFRYLECIVDSEILSSKFLHIAALCPEHLKSLKMEILTCLPEICSDNAHESLLRQLKNFMEKDERMIVPVLDTIGKLSLASLDLEEIHETVLSALNKYDAVDIPMILKFLLEISIDVQSCFRLMLNLQQKFDFRRVVHDKKAEKEEDKSPFINSINVIEAFLKYRKHIADGVIKYFDHLSRDYELNLLDVTLLIILLDSPRKRLSYNFIKLFLRRGNLYEDIFEDFFRNHSVLKRYFAALTDMAENFVRIFDPVMNSTGCSLYRIAFCSLDGIQRQEVISALVTHINSGSSHETDCGLGALDDLIRTHPRELCEYGLFIKNSLEYLNILNYAQVKKYFTSLGKLAVQEETKLSEDSDSIMEELNLVIRKYTSKESASENLAIGIICCAMVLKNLLPYKSQISKIVELYELVVENSDQNFVLIALFFEELSCAIRNTTVDKKVLAWIKKQVEKLFYDNYVLEDASKIKSYDMENRLICIGGKNKAYSSAIMIKHDEISSQDTFNDSAAALCSIFKILTACERLIDPELKEYRQYLGLPLVVLSQSSLDGFSSKSDEEKTVICKSLFYCTSWLRELLNIFGAIETEELTVEFVNVLSVIADLETKLSKFFIDLPNFYLPLINGTVQNCAIKKLPIKRTIVKEKRSRVSKKLKSIIEAPAISQDKNENSNDTESLDSGEAGPSTSYAPPRSVKSSLPPLRLSDCYKELDLSVHKAVLKIDLNFNGNEETQNNQFSIRFPEFLLLLEDLHSKLQHCFPSSTRGSWFCKVNPHAQLRFQMIDAVDSKTLYDSFVSLVTHLLKHLKSCRRFLKEKDNANESYVDQNFQVWSSACTNVTRCIETIVSCLLLIFQWKGTDGKASKEQTKLLLKILANFFCKSNTTQIAGNVAKIVAEELIQYSDACQSIISLNELLQIICQLCFYVDDSELGAKIATLALDSLKKEWPDFDIFSQKSASSKTNAVIKSLINIYFSKQTSKRLNVCEKMIQGVLEQGVEKSDDMFTVNEYKTVNKNTYPIWYAALFYELVSCTREIAQTIGDSEAPESALVHWVKAVRQFKFMISILKKVNARQVLIAAMQQGDIFLRIFIQNCMSLLDRTFSESFDDVKRLLSTVQNATRQLQTLCIHSKAMSKDKSLTKYVPPLKKTLEELLYRVKAMMAVNKCEKAIKISDLKLRNLQGEELLSQNFYYATAQGDDEETDVDDSVSKDGEITRNNEKDDEEEKESEPEENEEEHEDDGTNDDVTGSPVERTQMSDAF